MSCFKRRPVPSFARVSFPLREGCKTGNFLGDGGDGGDGGGEGDGGGGGDGPRFFHLFSPLTARGAGLDGESDGEFSPFFPLFPRCELCERPRSFGWKRLIFQKKSESNDKYYQWIFQLFYNFNFFIWVHYMQDTWYCYILRNTNEEYKNLTYNGSTNDPWRRLRQHNREIVGGAKATEKGKWEIYVLLTGFVNHNNALSCEWKIKHPTNKKQRPKKYCGVKGRVSSLNEVLTLDKWTNQCNILNKEC
ncbi:MAG: hypothetical protein EBQ92_00170, partial [Proteobacteria bacterium]|nr:hypothetical protein [Pseudomonadota bacterium]